MKRVVIALLFVILLGAPLLAARTVGYYRSGNNIVFVYNGKGATGRIRYVNVAGSFNGWKPKIRAWRMRKSGRMWYLGLSKNWIKKTARGKSGKHEFKFVVNGTQWIQPSKSTPNKVDDGFQGFNMIIRPQDLR